MARILNIVAQIIYLAKKSRNQLEKGRTDSVIRLFRVILALEEKQLSLIKKESGSQELEKQCLSIYQDTKLAFKESTQPDIKNVRPLLDRIIALEEIQLTNLPKSKKGLTKLVLQDIDPYIRELVTQINKLSFVSRTYFSCSGHFPLTRETNLFPYLVIEYDWGSRTEHNIESFHKSLTKIVAEAGILKPHPTKENSAILSSEYDLHEKHRMSYYLGFPIFWNYSASNLKKQIIKQWNQISILVRKYQDNDSLEYQKQNALLRNPRLLGNPLIIHQIMVKCPRCGTYMMTKDKRPKCRGCQHRFGNVIIPFRR